MNKGILQIWLLIAVLATFFQTGYCIRCYQCTSRREPRCADPISGDLRPTECTRESVSSTLNEITYSVKGSPGISDVFSGSTFSCLKINSHYNNAFHNVSVVRGCYYDHVDGRDLCTMLRTKVIDQSSLPFCETCTGDACNASNRIGSTVSLLSLFLPIFAFFTVLR